MNKAFKKEKEAELNSDVCDTDDANIVQERPIRKRIQRLLESSSEDECSKFSRPPQFKIKKLSGAECVI